MSFSEDGFEVVRSFINPQTMNLLKHEYHTLLDLLFENQTYSEQSIKFPTGEVLTCFNWYSPVFTESLSKLLQNKVEEIVEKKLVPTYSMVRTYKTGDELYKHRDRPSCQYSVTMPILTSINWPIYITDRKNVNRKVYLNEGDMLVYDGFLEHWREKYEGEKHTQCFLHWVDVNGKYKYLKYDGRANLALPMVKITEENEAFFNKH
jgi:hypothetical protein